MTSRFVLFQEQVGCQIIMINIIELVVGGFHTLRKKRGELIKRLFSVLNCYSDRFFRHWPDGDLGNRSGRPTKKIIDRSHISDQMAVALVKCYGRTTRFGSIVNSLSSLIIISTIIFIFFIMLTHHLDHPFLHHHPHEMLKMRMLA